MPALEISPLLLALGCSIVGSTLLVWHRHGGASWTLALGGLFFVLGRLMIVAICAFLLFVIAENSLRDSERHLIGAALAIPLLGIGGWSLFVIVRVVHSNAFGPTNEGATSEE
jgi:hypothetical protein